MKKRTEYEVMVAKPRAARTSGAAGPNVSNGQRWGRLGRIDRTTMVISSSAGEAIWVGGLLPRSGVSGNETMVSDEGKFDALADGCLSQVESKWRAG